VRRLWLWIWAGLIAAGVSAALLAGASVANAKTDSDPGTGKVASQSTDSGATGSASDGIAKRLHEVLSGHQSTTTSDAVAQRSTSDGIGTHRPLGLLRSRLSTTPGSSSAAFDGFARPAQTDRPLGLLRAHILNAEPSVAVDAPTVEAERSTTAAQPARAVGSPIGGIVKKVGSLAVETLQAVETVVTGPPKVPPNSTVTVHTSTLELSNGQTVPADWYFPETEDGKPPKNMILLQHGLLAQGPMYSYTAATLAEQTHSVVVTPTLPSDPFGGDDRWMGSTAMANSIGDLFLGDRAALTASAVDAGYASAYGLDPDTAQLPQKFALEGHSLGANVVSGAAGYIAEQCTSTSCAADDLVGVILLDGVPLGDTLPDALDKLAVYEQAGGHYIPVRAIGAPLNYLNSTSTVNDDLTAARPDKFNGVVLDGGVHMDSMRGGNPLIQFAAYAVAGFPQPQNPPAVDQLSATWLNEWFLDGDTGTDDGLVPGSAIHVDTPQGTATGVVIGATPPKILAGALRDLLPLLLSFLA
jgi:hypothetical protein